MSYVLKPSLKYIAAVKVAATLWNEDDVKELLTTFVIHSNFRKFKSEWVKIEAIAMKKVAKLPLPNELKVKILCFIRPIGFQIAKWRQFHNRGCNLEVDLPNEFYWTPQGTIDRKKTAEVMIKDESIDITTRYKLACIFCLEDDIPELWKKTPDDSKKFFYSDEDPIQVMQKEFVVLWTYQIKGEVDKIDSMVEKKMGRRCSVNECAFKLAASDGNIVATKYFLQKLTAAEREESLLKTAMSVAIGRMDSSNERTGFLRESYSDILCFLLSQLDEEKQLEVFKSHPCQVFTCLLDWPWQSFFMETANRMWNFLPKIIYQFVYIHFTGNMIEGYKDFNYGKLLRDFWEHSPDEYKRHILNDSIFRRIILELFQVRDLESIQFVFRDADSLNKNSIIFHHDGVDFCKKLIKNGEIDFLKYFIKECLTSKDEVVEFKEYFDEFHVNEYRRINWQRKLLCILDEIICEFQKKKMCER